MHGEDEEADVLPNEEESSAFLTSLDADEAFEFAGFDKSRESAGGQSRERSDVSLTAGSLLAVFAVYSLRIPLVPWLWNGTGLQYFIPIVSPVYREGEHWQAAHTRTAIVLHACFGSMMLFLGLAQVDQTFRRQNPRWHKWLGRVYIVCGLVTVGSLQVLQDRMGAGSTNTRSAALVRFVNWTSSGWIVATACGLWAARSKRIELHHRCMCLSLSLAATPIAQRILSWWLCAPAVIAMRIVFCVSNMGIEESYSQVPYVRWGGAPADTLWDRSCWQDQAAHSDPRARPFVFSFDGYGEGEQASFAVSAWLGFFTMLFVGISPWLESIEKQTSPVVPFKESNMLDVLRKARVNVTNATQQLWPDRHESRLMLAVRWLGVICLIGCVVTLGAGASVLLAVLITMGLTAAQMVPLLTLAAMFVTLWRVSVTLMTWLGLVT